MSGADGVAAGAYDMAVVPVRRQYAVNDVITCSVKGFPVPEVQWVHDGDETVTVTQSNLTVTDDMMNHLNSWTCSAHNELNTQPITYTIEFTVTAHTGICVFPFCLSVYLSVFLSVCLCVCFCLSVCLSTSLCVCFCLSTCECVCFCLLSICLSVCLSTCSQMQTGFYRAALNAGRSSHEKGVCPSVYLYIKRVNCDKMEEKSVQIFIP